MLKKISLVLFALLMIADGTAEAKKWQAKHVIFLGLDGWGSYSLSNIPNLQEMMDNGCYTLKKRTVIPSDSGPNWAAMFNGAPVEMSGFSSNSGKLDFYPVYANEHGMYPTIFYLFRQAYPEAEMGCIMEWGGIRPLVDEKSFSYIEKTSSSEVGCREWLDMTNKYIKEKKPAFLFVHVDQIDHSGHSNGHRTAEYDKTVSMIDGMVGEVVKAVKDAGIFDDTIFVIVSDHGGMKTGHGGTSMDEMETAFIICGKGVKKGVVIEEPMVQFDVAPTIAKIFNLKAPGCWRGKAMDVFK